MMECYQNNLSIDYYIENFVNNENLKTSEELEMNAIKSLQELRKRYNKNTEIYTDKRITIITTYEFIEKTYKNKLLFYSMNHPTKYLMQYICEEIIRILQLPNTINYEVDVLANPRCPLYKCIQKCVNFDINEYKPLTLGKTSIIEITHLYYDTYKEIGFK
jgi:hypothetical protein